MFDVEDKLEVKNRKVCFLIFFWNQRFFISPLIINFQKANKEKKKLSEGNNSLNDKLKKIEKDSKD